MHQKRLIAVRVLQENTVVAVVLLPWNANTFQAKAVAISAELLDASAHASCHIDEKFRPDKG